jgi:hypothetical protein
MNLSQLGSSCKLRSRGARGVPCDRQRRPTARFRLTDARRRLAREPRFDRRAPAADEGEHGERPAAQRRSGGDRAAPAGRRARRRCPRAARERLGPSLRTHSRARDRRGRRPGFASRGGMPTPPAALTSCLPGDARPVAAIDSRLSAGPATGTSLVVDLTRGWGRTGESASSRPPVSRAPACGELGARAREVRCEGSPEPSREASPVGAPGDVAVRAM